MKCPFLVYLAFYLCKKGTFITYSNIEKHLKACWATENTYSGRYFVKSILVANVPYRSGNSTRLGINLRSNCFQPGYV